ncbi:MAG: hypothetical protein DLM67_00420 [Candidatus Nephthysia bennettiae]|uniref:Uncharacterized protein n=1 Tax=Candidatus Nephthysia bennettiae TaxID=3127016 RepID=A0A934K8I7_9BACT|nr:hypothetical protein [Candidatus Dormibacteraeota bacterium]MBJ7612779.1 hypothetical protein [Candidatus Dormibacteraeota bacterium]PZS00790.1 MAG: hypothetical protein DLM67_00420 [Candidatus Dormibacteraeota bacterium]
MQFFTVDPAAVRRLSAAFDSASSTIGKEAGAFESSARLPGAAFGRLPEGLAASSHYEHRLGEALQGLAALQVTLEQVATNLRASADAYSAADQASLLE